MPEIQFFGVSKFYNKGKVKAVDNLNFTIKDGEYLSLLGPSGCGKTTTLRMLSGLIFPTKGKIVWDGKPIQDVGPEDRDIGYVFQQFAIFPHMNVWDNIAFGPQVKGYKKKDIEDIVERYMKIVGLTEKVDRLPKSLDAADLQRIGIARVLSTGAKTLLLDEPMGALDFKIREHFQDELLKLVKDLGLTAIHVTHDQSEAMAISDRIGVMKKGKMVQLGTPDELLFDPTQIFTAHFIGESDFLEGIISEVTESMIKVVLFGDEIIIIPQNRISRINVTSGQKVVLGVRREFFKIIEDGSDAFDNILIGRVISDRFLGEKTRTRIKLDYGRNIEVKRQPNEKSLKKDEKVKIQVNSNGVFLFNYPDNGLEDALEVT